MQRIDDIQLFLRVLDLGSISAAARQLDLSVAVASQRLKRLERSLGVRLLQRTTRRLHPTPEGAALAEQGRGPVETLEALTASLGQTDIITGIEINGQRRIPADTIRARIFSKAGDIYDQAAIERDFNSLWNTGYFEDLRFEREQTPKGWILHIYVKERPTIREIDRRLAANNYPFQ